MEASVRGAVTLPERVRSRREERIPESFWISLRYFNLLPHRARGRCSSAPR